MAISLRSRISQSNLVIELYCCLFLNIYYNGYGGALDLSGSQTNLSIQNTAFIEVSSENCGAIHTTSTCGIISARFIRFFRCNAKLHAAFHFGGTKININGISVSQCSPIVNYCSNIVGVVGYGYTTAKEINSTSTNADIHSGIHFYSIPNFGEIMYFNVVKNTNTGFVYGFNIVSKFFKNQYFNIINNSATTSLFHILSGDNGQFLSFIFQSNVGSITYSGFGITKGNITFFDCVFGQGTVIGPQVIQCISCITSPSVISTFSYFIFNSDICVPSASEKCICTNPIIILSKNCWILGFSFIIHQWT